MTLKYKPDFQRAQKYWDAFWVHDIIDRPCTAVWAKKRPEAVGLRRLQPIDADFQVSFDSFDEYLESYSFLGEAMPGFRPGFGPDQMAAFLGAPITISPDSPDTSWSEKIVEDWNDFLPLKLDEQNEYWQCMIEFHKRAEKYYEGKCLIDNIDLHSNIDTLEALRGAQKLLFDLIDTPDIIDEAMKQVRLFYTIIYNTFHEFGNKKELGTYTWLNLYNRGKTHAIQADFIALLNPAMFRRFVLPALREEADFLDNSVFHLDGPDALNHLDDILEIDDIEAIQWKPGAGRKPGWAWPEVIHKIQGAGKAAILYGNPEEIKSIHRQYKPELVFYDVHAQSEAEGNELLEWLGNNT